jgi:redox-sensitive bicupin YhaK (pirin superfamily)
MNNLDIERIRHPEPRGAGFPQLEAEYRRVLHQGREIRIDAGKRAEYEVAAGDQAVVYVMEGSVRFEGDDTAAGQGDIVWFKPAPPGDGKSIVGIEADMAFRGVLVTGRREERG